MDHDSAVRSQACEKYLLGELSPELRDAYEEHYFSCAECATQLRIATELVGAGQRIFAQAAAPAIDRRDHAAAPAGWLRWLRPTIAVPALAALLLIIGYQSLVIIPQLRQSQSPRILPMFSLISANARGEAVPEFTTPPNQSVGLYLDLPSDSAYSTYTLSLQDPSGKTAPLRSLTYADAQKTQVVLVNPGNNAGTYTLVITGQSASQRAAPSTELARIQFTIAFAP
jgi:hypothetical protein